MVALLLVCAFFVVARATDYSFSVDVGNINATVPQTFYGFTIDWWTADDPHYGQKWGNAGALTVDFSNQNFISLVSAISPAFLRIGGSPEDSIIYNVSGACLNVNASLPGYGCSQTHNNYGCLNMTRWQQINDFAVNTNTTLLFGLNGCYGRPSPNTSMNFSNIQGLFDATISTIDTHANLYGFELANELQSTINADTYAADFITVRKMIQTTFSQSSSGAPMPYLVGPDVGPVSYSQSVITAIQQQTNNKDVSSTMRAMTYHHYPNCGYPGNGVVFDLTCLEKIRSTAISDVQAAQSGMTAAWMGEGSEHSGGGTPNVSSTFVDCFYYLYQLCEVLTYGVTGTMRSDLIGGDYELIDKDTFLPNPDYWILYLLKMFVGDKLYSSSIPDGNLRAYAFNGNATNGNDQVVLALINFDLNNEAVVSLDVVNGAKAYEAEEFHLKPGGAELNAPIMMVNDVKMEYVNGQFPKVSPVQGNQEHVTLAPATLAFVVLTPK